MLSNKITNRFTGFLKRNQESNYDDLLKQVVNDAPVFLWAVNSETKIQLAEGSACANLGLHASTILGSSFQDIFPESTISLHHIHHILQHNQPRSWKDCLGDLYFDTIARPWYNKEGMLLGVVGVATNITPQVETKNALLDSEKRYALALDANNDGVWEWRPQRNAVYLSARFFKLLGYDSAGREIGYESEFLTYFINDDFEVVRSAFDRQVEGLIDRIEIEASARHRSGIERLFLIRGLPERDSYGQVFRITGSFTDITERRAAEQRLEYLAYHDQVTGLPNRNDLIRELNQLELDAQENNSVRYGLIVIELEQYQRLQDTLGRGKSEEILCAFARNLKSLLRPQDILSLIGEGKFAVLLKKAEKLESCEAVARRIHASIIKPLVIDGRVFYCTASLGISARLTGQYTAEELLRDADIAQHEVRQAGGNGWRVFAPKMLQSAEKELKTEQQLREAFRRHELTLHYQPLVHLQDRRLAGFEALVRWNTPDRGLVLPGEFIGVAERRGLISELSMITLRLAAEQIESWLLASAEQEHVCDIPSVAVNISPVSLNQPDFLVKINDILNEYPNARRYLKLEITEDAVMSNHANIPQTLAILEEQGLQLSLDDFGAGYSNFSRLPELPFSCLKIDRSLIRPLTSTRDKVRMILETMVSMGHKLGMEIVIEGIETEAQHDIVAAMGAQYGQGFLYSPGLPAAAAWTWIQAGGVPA